MSPQKKIPIREFDVIITGGGTAGVTAALSIKDKVTFRKVDIVKL